MQEINPVYRYQKLWLIIGYVLVALVMYLSITSAPPLPDVDVPYFDKLGHFLAYFVLMGWFAQIYHVKKMRVIFALAFIFMGLAMEFIQSFDPARMAEFADMVANTLGVVIALLITRMSAFRLILKKVETYM